MRLPVLAQLSPTSFPSEDADWSCHTLNQLKRGFVQAECESSDLPAPSLVIIKIAAAAESCFSFFLVESCNVCIVDNC